MKSSILSYYKKTKRVLLGFVLIILLTSCTSEVTSPLRIGVNLWPGYETLYLARALGYYDKEAIRLVDYPSTTEQIRAYRNEEIEGAAVSIDQALVLAETQKDNKIITIMDVSNGGDVILGRPEIKNIKALKGKRVGVETAAIGAFFISRALEKNGLTPQDIEIVHLITTEHEKAYRENQVDAVVTYAPASLKILEQGAKLLFDSSQIPGEIVDTLVLRQSAIRHSSAAIQSLIDGRFKALEYFKKHPKDAAIKIAYRTKVTPEQILSFFESIYQPSLEENQRLLSQKDTSLSKNMKKLAAVMIKNKLLTSAIEPKYILEPRFVNKSPK